MDGATILIFVFQTAITIIVAIASWGVKNAMGTINKAIEERKEADVQNAEQIAHVHEMLHELKSELPLHYALREDFLRSIDKIDEKLDPILQRGDSHKHNAR